MREITFATTIASSKEVLNEAKNGEYSKIQRGIEEIQKRIDSNFVIYFLDKNGISQASTIFTSEIGLDLSDREYFINAKRLRETVISEPVYSRGRSSLGELLVVIAAPVFDEEEFYGIIGLPFKLDYFLDILLQRKAGKSGIAFLMNSDGLVLIHPEEKNNLKTNIYDLLNDEKAKELREKKLSGTIEYMHEGIIRVAGFSRMGITGWMVAYRQNRDEILTPVYNILTLMLVIAISFLVITIFLIFLYYNEVGTPIQKLLEMTRQVTQNASDVIVQIDSSRKVIFANPAFEKTTGKMIADVIGKEPLLVNTNEIPAERIWKSLEEGNLWSGRIIYEKGAGNNIIVVVDTMIAPLKNKNNKIESYLQIGHDITSEIMYEKRLQQAQKLEAIGTLAGRDSP